MNRRLANVLSAVSMFAVAAANNAAEAIPSGRIMPPPGCGFVQLSEPIGDLTARYFHCGDSFILIKIHWSGGSSRTSCVPPWYQLPFYRAEGQVVVNAYYVSVPPNLSGPAGNQMCSLSQPHA